MSVPAVDLPTSGPELTAFVDELLARMVELAAEQEENKETAKRRIQMLKDWRDNENAVLQRKIDRIETLIQDVTRTYDYGRKKKSRTLASGTFGLRKEPDTIEIVDMAKAVQWAEQNGLAREIKKSIDKKPLKQRCALFFTRKNLPNPDSTGFAFKPGEGDRFFVSPNMSTSTKGQKKK